MSILSNIRDFLRCRTFKMYSVATFQDTYNYGLLDKEVGEDVFWRLMEAENNGQLFFKVFDDEMERIVAEQKCVEEFNYKIARAAELNNEGIALEKSGDIAGAIAKYEENILPEARLSHHPFKRLCVLYRKAGEYDNEIRVIESFLAREDAKTSPERQYYQERLAKAKSYKLKTK